MCSDLTKDTVDLFVKGILISGHLSNEHYAYCPRYIARDVCKATSEILAPL